MITRSRRDSNYEFLELPNKKKQKKQHIIEQSVIAPSAVASAIPSSILDEYTGLQSEISIHNTEYRPLYEVNIDFDEAHREWVKNKIKMPNGCYRYKRDKRSKNKTK